MSPSAIAVAKGWAVGSRRQPSSGSGSSSTRRCANRACASGSNRPRSGEGSTASGRSAIAATIGTRPGAQLGQQRPALRGAHPGLELVEQRVVAMALGLEAVGEAAARARRCARDAGGRRPRSELVAGRGPGGLAAARRRAPSRLAARSARAGRARHSRRATRTVSASISSPWRGSAQSPSCSISSQSRSSVSRSWRIRLSVASCSARPSAPPERGIIVRSSQPSSAAGPAQVGDLARSARAAPRSRCGGSVPGTASALIGRNLACQGCVRGRDYLRESRWKHQRSIRSTSCRCTPAVAVRALGDRLVIEALTVNDERAARLVRERAEAGQDPAATVASAIEVGARVLDNERHGGQRRLRQAGAPGGSRLAQPGARRDAGGRQQRAGRADRRGLRRRPQRLGPGRRSRRWSASTSTSGSAI